MELAKRRTYAAFYKQKTMTIKGDKKYKDYLF